MTLPNFVVIGAGRSGTTSLDRYLRQHPDVYLPPVKAPSHFFCEALERIEDPALRLVTRNYFVPDRRDYEALFDGVTRERAVGEVSPVYLATTQAAPRMSARIPDARLLAILRNPVERVHARYVGRRRDGLERRELGEIVREERSQPLERDVSFGTYLASGCTSHVLRTYYDHYPRARVRVYLFEELQRDPAALMRDVFSFLGVDPDAAVDVTTRHNVSRGVIANPAARWVWTRTALPRAAVRRHLPPGVRDAVFSLFARELVPLPLDETLRAELVELYRDEVTALSELLDRDLSSWLA